MARAVGAYRPEHEVVPAAVATGPHDQQVSPHACLHQDRPGRTVDHLPPHDHVRLQVRRMGQGFVHERVGRVLHLDTVVVNA